MSNSCPHTSGFRGLAGPLAGASVQSPFPWMTGLEFHGGGHRVRELCRDLSGWGQRGPEELAGGGGVGTEPQGLPKSRNKRSRAGKLWAPEPTRCNCADAATCWLPGTLRQDGPPCCPACPRGKPCPCPRLSHLRGTSCTLRRHTGVHAAGKRHSPEAASGLPQKNMHGRELGVAASPELRAVGTHMHGRWPSTPFWSSDTPWRQTVLSSVPQFPLSKQMGSLDGGWGGLCFLGLRPR